MHVCMWWHCWVRHGEPELQSDELRCHVSPLFSSLLTGLRHRYHMQLLDTGQCLTCVLYHAAQDRTGQDRTFAQLELHFFCAAGPCEGGACLGRPHFAVRHRPGGRNGGGRGLGLQCPPHEQLCGSCCQDLRSGGTAEWKHCTVSYTPVMCVPIVVRNVQCVGRAWYSMYVTVLGFIVRPMSNYVDAAVKTLGAEVRSVEALYCIIQQCIVPSYLLKAAAKRTGAEVWHCESTVLYHTVLQCTGVHGIHSIYRTHRTCTVLSLYSVTLVKCYSCTVLFLYSVTLLQCYSCTLVRQVIGPLRPETFFFLFGCR